MTHKHGHKLPCQPFWLPKGKGASGHMPTTALLDARRGDMPFHGCRGGGSTFLQFGSHTHLQTKNAINVATENYKLFHFWNQGNTLQKTICTCDLGALQSKPLKSLCIFGWAHQNCVKTVYFRFQTPSMLILENHKSLFRAHKSKKTIWCTMFSCVSKPCNQNG